MSDSYAAAGVDTSQADRAVDALVAVLRTIELDRPSASVLPSGHYASVLRVAPNLGIAVSTDVVGLPSSGLHSNGYTLARRALLDEGGLTLTDRPGALEGRSVADALLEPTVIYVRAVLELLRSDVPVHGLAHITGGGLRNLLRLGGDRLGFAVDEPLPVP